MKPSRQLRMFAGLAAGLAAASALAFTPSQQPPSTSAVPGNVMLALSVEFPTGLQVSYSSENYGGNNVKYEGYFDNRKCYTYRTTNEVFEPTSAITAAGACQDTEWSGNLLNWLTMTNLDQFRSVMTGGTRDNFSPMNASHAGDNTTRTVLIRSFSDRNSYNPIKRIRNSDPIPTGMRSTTARYVRSGGYGSKFIVSTSNNFSDLGTHALRAASCASTTPFPTSSGSGSCFNIRVAACVPSAAQGVTGNVREANCQAKYSGVAKPEGLIQEYSSSLRFAAFGYLKQDGNARNGGVLRSAMKSVGPLAATSTGVQDNPNVEWNTTTGVILSNPDPVDATASGVSNSGLMNYLNKFGYASGYKSNDPVSELYYAALRYMRGYALPNEYTNDLTDASRKDGFPVITGAAHERSGARDPMINTCQRNFLLGIGDIYTHEDGNLPGRTGGPTDPDGLNANTLWSTLTGLEGSSSWTGGSSGGTQYIAGFAHWAHTNDIRGDLDGTQTMATYWVDVLENTNGQSSVLAASQLKTQYWLATKYGGFDKSLASGNNPNARAQPTNALPWDGNGDGVPNTWFAGSTPTQLRTGLSAAFNKINQDALVGAASSAAVTSNRQTSDSETIYGGYNPREWTGNVRSCRPDQTATQCENAPRWDASNWLHRTSTVVPAADKLTAETRKIFTSLRNASSFQSMPFRWASLVADQTSVLNADNNGQQRVAFLRGDRAQEGILFRNRPDNLLGDVVNSGIAYLAGPGPALSGPSFPGHSAYRNANRSRPAVVYVGANDGMLHAFSGANGKELFGYVPGSVLTGLNNLSAFNFQHRFLVDGSPMVGDFELTASTPQAPSWGTMLVGGLGAGGRGYYALNLSNQSNFATSTEATLAGSLPMWEFTSAQDGDLGYTFNEPSINSSNGAYRQIAKVADATVSTGVWRVIVGNGYGSTDGKAVLFMLNANTGEASTKLTAHTPANAAAPRSGLSAPTPVDVDRDGLIDTVYAGDILGNMHKFQFSKESGVNFVLARHGDAGAAWRYLGVVYAAGEPITTAPTVIPACSGNGWSVMFGTGKLNEQDDYFDRNSVRAFYNVVDQSPSSTLTVPASDLAAITSFTSVELGNDYVGRNWSAPDLSTKRGWKIVLPAGERVLTNSTLPPDTGAVLFASTQPTGDLCTPGNTGYIMAADICTGGIGNLIYAGQAVGGIAVDSDGVIKVSNTYTSSQNKQIVVCNQAHCKELGGGGSFNPSIAPRGRYSWRELLTK